MAQRKREHRSRLLGAGGGGAISRAHSSIIMSRLNKGGSAGGNNTNNAGGGGGQPSASPSQVGFTADDVERRHNDAFSVSLRAPLAFLTLCGWAGSREASLWRARERERERERESRNSIVGRGAPETNEVRDALVTGGIVF